MKEEMKKPEKKSDLERLKELDNQLEMTQLADSCFLGRPDVRQHFAEITEYRKGLSRLIKKYERKNVVKIPIELFRGRTKVDVYKDGDGEFVWKLTHLKPEGGEN